MSTSESNLLACIEIEPETKAQYSIIWLHGLGADASDFVPIIPELALPNSLPVRFVFPHAPIMPVTINQGTRMPAWYDIYSLSINQEIDEAGMARATSHINKLIEKEISRGIRSTHIILAGFSQGAVVALLTGLNYGKRLGGVLALSGYLPLTDEAVKASPSLNQATPIFVAHGMDDPIVPYTLGKAAYVSLHAAGHPVAWHSYPIPHSVCAEEIRDISQWIQQVWSSTTNST